MKKRYLFQSERLGFRTWTKEDIPKMAKLNADAKVMAFFPATQDWKKTASFVEIMQERFAEKGYCYFAVDRLDNGSFIGFIGITEQNYEAYFTPCIDIGWRLNFENWGNGFATEGAIRCLEYAFKELKLKRIVSVCSKPNVKSEKVMQKIGMQRIGEFKHPFLKDDRELEDCVLYEIKKI